MFRGPLILVERRRTVRVRVQSLEQPSDVDDGAVENAACFIQDCSSYNVPHSDRGVEQPTITKGESPATVASCFLMAKTDLV